MPRRPNERRRVHFRYPTDGPSRGAAPASPGPRSSPGRARPPGGRSLRTGRRPWRRSPGPAPGVPGAAQDALEGVRVDLVGLDRLLRRDVRVDLDHQAVRPSADGQADRLARRGDQGVADRLLKGQGRAGLVQERLGRRPGRDHQLDGVPLLPAMLDQVADHPPGVEQRRGQARSLGREPGEIHQDQEHPLQLQGIGPDQREILGDLALGGPGYLINHPQGQADDVQRGAQVVDDDFLGPRAREDRHGRGVSVRMRTKGLGGTLPGPAPPPGSRVVQTNHAIERKERTNE